MKKIFTKIICCLLVLCCINVTPVYAAKKPNPPKKVTIQHGIYYTYWKAHKKELNKQGIYQGDVYDAQISWSKVKNADGYVCNIYWKSDEDEITEKTVVRVKKINNNKYKFTATDYNDYGQYHDICKDVKEFILAGNMSVQYEITNNKLAFHVNGNSSCISIDKVVMRSYKIVKGKKVYSKPITKR